MLGQNFKAKICIPMGIDPAPQMANGHLQKYEFDFQQKMCKTNYSVTRSPLGILMTSHL